MNLLYFSSLVNVTLNSATEHLMLLNIFGRANSLLQSLFQGLQGLVVSLFSIALIIIFMGSFFGSQESKQKMKSALPWAFLAFIGALSITLIINWIQTNW